MKYFEHGHFDANFIRDLQAEIPVAIQHATNHFDWDAMVENKRYHTRIHRRIQRKKLDTNHHFDWKDDPGEKAWRIWEWWKTKFTDHEHELGKFKEALRIVVLSQLSSCSVERVLSRVNDIRKTCGDNMFEDIFELRMMMMCNGYLDDMVNNI